MKNAIEPLEVRESKPVEAPEEKPAEAKPAEEKPAEEKPAEAPAGDPERLAALEAELEELKGQKAELQTQVPRPAITKE